MIHKHLSGLSFWHLLKLARFVKQYIIVNLYRSHTADQPQYLGFIEGTKVPSRLQRGNHAGVESGVAQRKGVDQVQHAIGGVHILLNDS